MLLNAATELSLAVAPVPARAAAAPRPAEHGEVNELVQAAFSGQENDDQSDLSWK